LKYDGYSAKQGAKYAREIAANAAMNPWADPNDAPAYAEAARRLESEIDNPIPNLLATFEITMAGFAGSGNTAPAGRWQTKKDRKTKKT
jgi:hypothetical protein